MPCAFQFFTLSEADSLVIGLRTIFATKGGFPFAEGLGELGKAGFITSDFVFRVHKGGRNGSE